MKIKYLVLLFSLCACAKVTIIKNNTKKPFSVRLIMATGDPIVIESIPVGKEKKIDLRNGILQEVIVSDMLRKASYKVPKNGYSVDIGFTIIEPNPGMIELRRSYVRENIK